MTRVIKIGGRVQGDQRLSHVIRETGRRGDGASDIVVVHGGGDEVSALQRELGHEPRFVGGRRATTEQELDIVRMVLSGTANKRLVAAFQTAGVRAVGISGEDGGLLTAHVAPGAPLGRVGERVHADASVLRDLLAAGWLPVVSPLARDGDDPNGGGLNVNGDDAAAAIAIALRASELVFVADVDGVMVDGTLQSVLTHDAAHGLIARGIAAGGMAAKLQAGQLALGGGVARVRIASLAGIGSSSSGTTLLPSQAVAPWPQ